MSSSRSIRTSFWVMSSKSNTSGRSRPGACSVFHWSVCSARTQEIAWRNLSRRVMDTGCTFGKIGRGSASPTAGWYWPQCALIPNTPFGLVLRASSSRR